MTRRWPTSLVFTLSLLLGGWLLFDGTRAFITGMYTTPGSGEYAGQLGPWSRVVSAVGLDPNGLLLRSIHLLLGASWILCGLQYFRRRDAAWKPLLVVAMASFWYLPFGTLIAAVVAGILWATHIKRPNP